MLSSNDILSIIELLSEAKILRPYKITGDWYSCYCPLHAEGKERRASFGILLNNIKKDGIEYTRGYCHCFTCQLNISLPNLVKKLLEIHIIDEDIKQQLLDICDASTDNYNDDSILPAEALAAITNKFALNYIQNAVAPIKQYVSEEELKKYRYTVPYMYERGLTDEIIEKYDIGVDVNFIPPGRKRSVPCITFPVKDEYGNVLFISRRSIKNKMFFLPTGISKPVYGLYEIPKETKSIIITESIFNCLSCVKYGKQAVALFGTGTAPQIAKIRSLGVPEYIIGLDPDEAGKRATAKIKRQLKDVAIVWEYAGIPEGKDLNDLTEDEFKSLHII